MFFRRCCILHNSLKITELYCPSQFAALHCENFHFSAYYLSAYSFSLKYSVCTECLSRFSKLQERDFHEGSEKEWESFNYMLDVL